MVEMNADGRAIALDPEKLLVREDGSPARGDVEFGRLGITGFEDESRLRAYGGLPARNEGSAAAAAVGARVEQGTPERSGVNPVLESFRVLETNPATVRLQDAALDRGVNSRKECSGAGLPGERPARAPFECPGAREGALT